MEQKSDDMIKFKLFLEEFTAKHNGPLTSDDPLPFRLVTYRMTPDEVEGECIEWVMEYLFGQNHCPPVYAAAIAKATVDAINASDISSYENTREEDEGTYVEANGFARFVFSHVHKICEEWNSSMPALEINPRVHQVSLESVRNGRRKMEDKHVVLQDVNTLFKSRLTEPDGKPRSFYAVYDGHGGVDASYYAAAHLHLHTVLHPDFTRSPTDALKTAFVETDEAFIRKARREGLRSGTTGVAAVVEPDAIHLAWLGDSQAVLMRNCQPVEVMEPHKPDREDEKTRIEDLGGCVVWFGGWRVNGSLAVSRSIGDPEYKPYVCSDADTIVIPLDGTEECLIVACDGLWDVITPEGACKAIEDYIKSGSDLSGIAKKLVAMAKEARSSDNITVLVVFLNPHRVKVEVSKESEQTQVAVDEKDGRSEAESGKGQGSNSDHQSSNSGKDQNISHGSVVGRGDTSEKDGLQNPVDGNSNNNNINKNLARQARKNKMKSSRQKRGFIIKNGVNDISKSMKNQSLNGSKSQHSSPTSNSPLNSKSDSTPDLISDYSAPNPVPISNRRTSISKRAVNPIRRSSSTPPVHRKSSSAIVTDEVTIKDLWINVKKKSSTKSASPGSKPPAPGSKPTPIKHKSMPISIKPKSMIRTRSLPRDPKLAAIMKNKLSAQTASNDVQR